MLRFNSAARRGILFVVLSWLCVSLAMLLGMAWLHTPAKTPSVNYKVWVACAGLVGSAVAWMFMHFTHPRLEARWVAAIMRRRALHASDPLRGLRGRAPRNVSWASNLTD